jgi:predicted unusual protein kinase regulating ubiquinone biosynthesis (AarF/ABC1/UbiB family)
MEFLEGIPAERACSERYPRELRDRWGRALFEFQMRGLFEHRFLHADPNLANFSFLEDGRLIVYDFGCVKRIPAPIAAGYAELFLTALEGREEEIPDVLLRMGVFQGDRAPLPRDLTDAYVRLFSEVLRDKPPYTFGEDENLYRKLIDLGIANWSRAVDIRFPEDVVFIDRALAGHFGNLARLGATGPWRELVRKYAQGARNRAPTAR